MGISGSQRAYSMAQGGVMRGSSSRGNVHTPKVFVAIAGVQYGTARAVDSQQVDNETLSITENEGETPNTASFQVRGFQPTDGQDVVITQGSINNLDRLFAGTVMTDAHSYLGTPANGRDQVNVIDYTWQLTRGTISRRWTNVSGTVIAQDILADAGRGFSAEYIEAGLPVVDEFSVTNQTHASALGALCTRLGASYWKVNYDKEVWLGLTSNPNQTNPTELTDASALLTEMSDLKVTRDLGQVITRQPVEGGGSNAFAEVLPGATELPVEDDAFYNASGGTVVSGPQRLTYTGLGFDYARSFSWTAQPTAAQIRWWGVTWSPTRALFVAVGLDGGNRVMTSPDGTTWTLRAGDTNHNWADVIWVTELGLFVAAGHDGFANPIMTSPDGITWTVRTAPTAGPNSLAWSPSLALLVAVGWVGVDRVLTSPDGITWTARSSSDDSLAWEDVVWAPALGRFTAVTATGTQRVMTSPDGITWTGRTVTAQPWRGLAWSEKLGLFVAVGDTGSVMSSPDGITWTDRTAAEVNSWKKVVWTDALGLFVAVSSNGTNRVMTSADGITWVARPAPLGEWQGLAWAPEIGTVLAVGDNASSPTTWVMTSASPPHPTLTGIPASGAGAILYTIKQGDPVNLRVVVDDLAAQAALATLIGGGDDGIIEGAVIQDGRISETEAIARGEAQLALRKDLAVSASYLTHDKNTHASREISFDLDEITGTLRLQSVTIDKFHPSRWQTHHAQASSKRFSLEMLLRLARSAA